MKALSPKGLFESFGVPVLSVYEWNSFVWFLVAVFETVFSSGVELFMGDGPRGVKVIHDHFLASPSTANSLPSPTSSVTDTRTNSDLRSHSRLWVRRKLESATSMLNLFSLRRLPWGSGADGQEKVVLSAVEVASLRSEIASLEERESHYKAQLEHLDEILRSARLSSYLYIRSRWEALPGEPPPLDDTEVDDWIPRFVLLHGSCIYLFLSSTDLSPQDSTLLSDIVEVDSLPCLTREDEETRYCFYILTRHGLRYECSSVSKIQVDSWVAALKIDCKLGTDGKDISDIVIRERRKIIQ
ncbi:Pleckstrin-like proteiny (PH) domain-containing protein [Forsythia ovata]|uniref:Pleckstrin-like proteiny (PH) domain-containing protein n=1 Tax=Forsythia ovata TaxID=205694 RepID=A0ABD1W214_9LAMI